MDNLYKIIVGGNVITRRDTGDLAEWLKSIRSVTTHTSFKGRICKDGVWEDCVVSAKIEDIYTDKIGIYVFYTDGSMYIQHGQKEAFLPEAYVKRLDQKEEYQKRKRKEKYAKGRKKIMSEKALSLKGSN